MKATSLALGALLGTVLSTVVYTLVLTTGGFSVGVDRSERGGIEVWADPPEEICRPMGEGEARKQPEGRSEVSR